MAARWPRFSKFVVLLERCLPAPIGRQYAVIDAGKVFCFLSRSSRGSVCAGCALSSQMVGKVLNLALPRCSRYPASAFTPQVPY
eukprot:COSAG05_NODE_12284_length_474_cov_1.098667_1_plen_83_part_01